MGWKSPGRVSNNSITAAAAKSLSRVRLFATSWTVAQPGFLVHGILQATLLCHYLFQLINRCEVRNVTVEKTTIFMLTDKNQISHTPVKVLSSD